MSGLAKCPRCDKLIAVRFPVHNCKKKVSKMTSTSAVVEGLDNFGKVDIRKITHQRSGARLSTRAGKWVGVVYVPVDYPGSSTVGAPEGCALMGVVSYDGGETWALL